MKHQANKDIEHLNLNHSGTKTGDRPRKFDSGAASMTMNYSPKGSINNKKSKSNNNTKSKLFP